jgi:branched-chain amino acid transport system ATP-binding protein
MNDLLTVKGLVAGHRGVSVVHGIDLTVAEGEVVGLFGPNGAGKTTTLLTISGLLRALGGSVRVLGKPATKLAPTAIARLGVAHVPEDRALFTQLTVAENLRLGARRGAAGQDEVLRHFPELIPLQNRTAGLLSGGEQQMLALARALISRPRLLIVDEMSLGLAPVIVRRHPRGDRIGLRRRSALCRAAHQLRAGDRRPRVRDEPGADHDQRPGKRAASAPRPARGQLSRRRGNRGPASGCRARRPRHGHRSPSVADRPQ